MTDNEKINFYNLNKQIIHPNIKAGSQSKPLWRKLFWTTARNSNEYKIGCVDIFKCNFPDLYEQLIKANIGSLN